MRRKTKVILLSYAAAALTVFAVLIYQGCRNLRAYRLAAQYSSGRAFEETVGAVRDLSGALEKCMYASDSGMCARLCSEIYASSLSAETALSSLPFATQELEQVSEFLNMTGDYAYALNCHAGGEGFTAEERECLQEMSETAEDFADCLDAARRAVYDGSLIIDSREKRLRNIFADEEARKLSARMLQYESEFRPLGELVYDGRYGQEQKKGAGAELSGEEMLELAAGYLNTEPAGLKKEYEYEGTEGRCCYSAGDMMICLSPAGVESFSGSRLVGDINISPEEAEAAAEAFLEKQGFRDMELAQRELSGALMDFEYSKTEGDALFLDNCVKLSVAMDDGSVYSFNAADYRDGLCGAEWKLSRQEAEQTLPDSLRCAEGSKVIRSSPGGRDRACWELSCVNRKGRGVKIYVDAENGKQFDIVPEDRES